MDFVLATGGIMLLSILLIYKLGSLLGLEIKWLSLVLCAVLAFAVNGMAIVLSPFLDHGHYLRLGVLVLVAAALVTAINEFLVRRSHRHQLAAAGGPEVAIELEGTDEPQDNLLAASTEVGNQLSERLAEAIKANTAEEAKSDEAETSIEAESGETETASTESTESAEIAAEQDVADEAVDEPIASDETAETLSSTEATSVAEAAETTEATEIIEAAETVEPAEAEADTEPAAQAEAETEAEEAGTESEADHLADVELAVESLGSLDELLDFAYSHKANDPAAAICAYQAAIKKYPEDSYAPFLIIELAGLYKEQAAYNEAINLYAESLAMPIIAGDDAMMQEFSKTLRYLGTVQDILKKHHALATPFSALSSELLAEIEEEFSKRQAK